MANDLEILTRKSNMPDAVSAVTRMVSFATRAIGDWHRRRKACSEFSRLTALDLADIGYPTLGEVRNLRHKPL